MKNNVAVSNLTEKKTVCCGCGVCAFLCPVSAITMEEDNEGFLYPSIDANKCIACQKCVHNCALKERRDFVRENRQFNL